MLFLRVYVKHSIASCVIVVKRNRKFFNNYKGENEMSKRFTDTDKWKDEWFKKLNPAHKLLWLYISDDCNHAGIWHVDLEIAQLRIGYESEIDKDFALELFGDKIISKDNGEKWFIPSFIEEQYGRLNSANKVHNSVIKLLSNQGLLNHIQVINEGLLSSLQGAKDKDKVKDKVQVKVTDKDNGKKIIKIENEVTKEFREFHRHYPGRKRSVETEYENFQKKYKNWQDILPLLIPAIRNEEAERLKAQRENKFYAEPKDLSTWINNECWQMFLPVNSKSDKKVEAKPIVYTETMTALLNLPVGSLIKTPDGRIWKKVSSMMFEEYDTSEEHSFLITEFEIHYKNKTFTIIDTKEDGNGE